MAIFGSKLDYFDGCWAWPIAVVHLHQVTVFKQGARGFIVTEHFAGLETKESKRQHSFEFEVDAPHRDFWVKAIEAAGCENGALSSPRGSLAVVSSESATSLTESPPPSAHPKRRGRSTTDTQGTAPRFASGAVQLPSTLSSGSSNGANPTARHSAAGKMTSHTMATYSATKPKGAGAEDAVSTSLPTVVTNDASCPNDSPSDIKGDDGKEDTDDEMERARKEWRATHTRGGTRRSVQLDDVSYYYFGSYSVDVLPQLTPSFISNPSLVRVFVRRRGSQAFLRRASS